MTSEEMVDGGQGEGSVVPSKKEELLRTLEHTETPERRYSLARVEELAKTEEEREKVFQETTPFRRGRPPSAVERDGDWESAVLDHREAYEDLLREFRGENQEREEEVEQNDAMVADEMGEGVQEEETIEDANEEDDIAFFDDSEDEGEQIGEASTIPHVSFEDTLSKYETMGGVLSTFKGRGSRKQGTVRKAALRAIEEHELDLVVKERLAMEAKERVTRENDKAIQLHNDCTDLVEQIKDLEAELARKGLPDSQDLQGLRRKYRNALEKAEMQEEILQKEDTYCAGKLIQFSR